MPTKVTLDDDREYLEYSIQELEKNRMAVFLRDIHRWQTKVKANKSPEPIVGNYRQPKYTNPRTPNRYKK